MTLPSEDIRAIARGQDRALEMTLLAIARKADLMERELGRFQAEAAARQPSEPHAAAMATLRKAVAGNAPPTQAMRDLMKHKPRPPRDFA